MRLSKMYMPTLREIPNDAEVPSHQYLLRAAMIMQNASGVYSYLPLGHRVIRKIEEIVREEMDAIGGQEVLMSPLQPKEIWEESGRWAVFGPEMFKLKDRHARDFCLAPTAEEYFTTLVRDKVTSYKELPMDLYQIQTKYRDEKRPRFGVTRAREFIMKDAYTFDADIPGMKKSYEEMWHAYERMFDRMGLEYTVVAGDAGAMGGNSSHEFIALSEVGEGLIAYSSCGYAATDEKARVVYDVVEREKGEIEKVATPEMKTIAEVAEFLGKDPADCMKTVAYKVGDEVIFVLIPGDRELNETKLLSYLGVPEHELLFANDEEIASVGSHGGFMGPVGIEGARIVVDERITRMGGLVTGANEEGYHLTNVVYGRDYEGEVVEDLLLVREGDVCPECGEKLTLKRGIEVGNIFQLGQKYSKSLGAKFLDENGKSEYFWMGSHGVGVSRSMAAVIEQHHDENGIIWPISVAPYEVMITLISNRDEKAVEAAETLYRELTDAGIEVLYDDRNERAGVKFNDRDLIGIPLRIGVGRKAADGIVEYSDRAGTIDEEIAIADAKDVLKEEIAKRLAALRK